MGHTVYQIHKTVEPVNRTGRVKSPLVDNGTKCWFIKKWFVRFKIGQFV